MYLCVDGVGYLLIMFRDYQELHRLTRSIDNIVTNIAGYQRKGYAIDNRLHAMEKNIR